MKKTVVLGASENPSRYSFMATSRLVAHGHPVVAIGNKEGKIGNTNITKEHPAMDDVDTVTLYLNPTNQQPYYDYILSLKPKRVIFNPATENPALEEMVAAQGAKAMEP